MDAPTHTLEPLPYHVELRDYLKSQERELWNWFASARAQADYTENFADELLPPELRNANPLGIGRLVNGQTTRGAV